MALGDTFFKDSRSAAYPQTVAKVAAPAPVVEAPAVVAPVVTQAPVVAPALTTEDVQRNLSTSIDQMLAREHITDAQIREYVSQLP